MIYTVEGNLYIFFFFSFFMKTECCGFLQVALCFYRVFFSQRFEKDLYLCNVESRKVLDMTY